MNRSLATLAAAVALGLSVVIGTIIVSGMVTYVKTFNTSLLKVVGSASQTVTSNQVKWTGSFSTTTDLGQLQQGYATMDRDRAEVTAFLTKGGISSANVTFTPVHMNRNFINCKINPKACGASGPTSYTLQQNVVVQSPKVQKVTDLSQHVSPLIQKGVVFSSNSVAYYYTKLAGLRSKLLAAATENAKGRAEAITGRVGEKVGKLISVSDEPFQLTPVDSTEVSNNGSYDTSTIAKKLTAIVVARFRLP